MTEPFIYPEATEKAAEWPIRVGGVYRPSGGTCFDWVRKVTGITGGVVFYEVYFSSGSILNKDGRMPTSAFRSASLPEDQSPIPALVAALKAARSLGSIGYYIGEADMRSHDKVGERWAAKQREIEDQIDAALALAEQAVR